MILRVLQVFSVRLKFTKCPFCGRIGTLNRHSVLRGNDPAANTGRIIRGQRVFCSSRGQRGGCGGTFPVMFDWVMPRHSFIAPLLWQAVCRRIEGVSASSAWHTVKTPLALDSFYHFLQRTRLRLSVLRAVLCSAVRPPSSRQADPLLQTFEHLRAVFPDARCPISAFQMRFQTPFSG